MSSEDLNTPTNMIHINECSSNDIDNFTCTDQKHDFENYKSLAGTFNEPNNSNQESLIENDNDDKDI